MLIYNQAYDLYHTMFRLIQLTNSMDINEEMEIDKLRILDFYFAFPNELIDIKRFRGFKKYEKFINAEENRYERVIDRRRIFFKMENIQMLAIKALVSYGIFKTESFRNGKIKKTGKDIDNELSDRLKEANKENQNLITLITGPLASINLYGHLGLKERTNLIEFKYDAI